MLALDIDYTCDFLLDIIISVFPVLAIQCDYHPGRDNTQLRRNKGADSVM